jgi:hypothetical protein
MLAIRICGLSPLLRRFHNKCFSPVSITIAVLTILTASSGVLAHADEASRAQTLTASYAPSQFDLVHKPLGRIEPGIVIGQERNGGYSDLVTLVLPRLASGYVDSLPDYAKRYASMFKLAVLANVAQHQVNGRPVYSLDKVRLGFAMDIKGKMTIVTRDTANQLGASLGMIDRTVLSGSEDSLDDVVQVARNNRMIIFDAKANMLVGEAHEERIVRHFIWV